MADLNALTYCRLVGLYNSVVADTVGPYGDTDERPDMFKPYMDATITVFIAGQEGRTPELRLEDANPPRTVLLTPIDCVVEAGVFRLKSQNTGIDGVDIIAKSAIMGLGTTPLLCRVDFGPVKIAGRTYQYEPVTFVLPTIEREDYTAGVHQVVTVTGSPTGGLFRLLYENSATSTLPRTATAAVVQAAMRAIPAIGNNVTVTGPAGGPWDVVFTGALAADMPSPLSGSDSFTGGTAPQIVVTDTYQPVTLDLSTVDRVDLPPTTTSQLVVRMIPDQVLLEEEGPPSRIRFYAGGEPIGESLPLTVDLSAENITDSGAVGRQVIRAENRSSLWAEVGAVPVECLPPYIGEATETGRSVLTGSALQGRTALGAVALRSAVRDDPTNHPDGPIAAGDALDAGTVFNVTGSKHIRYQGGRFVHDPASASGTSAGYLQVELDAPVRSIRAQMAWSPNALGSVALVIPSPAATWAWPTTLPAAGVHITAYGNGVWNAAVWNPGAGGATMGQIHHSVQPGSATSFTLTVQTTTPAATQTTASITAGASAAEVTAAITALSNVGTGKVTVTKSASGNYGITWAGSLGTVTLTATGSGGTMGMSAPLPANPANAIPGVVTYGVGLTVYGDYTTAGRYSTVWDNQMRWFEVFVYPETDEVFIVFPDGTNSGMLRHPGIGLWASSKRAVWELFENNTGVIDVPAALGSISADSQQVTGDSPFLTKPQLLSLISRTKPVTLYEGGNATTSDISVSGSIPPGTQWLELVMIGGGGGGGSGGCQPLGTSANGGAAGGSGGVIREIITASILGTSWFGIVGRAGLGGASISAAGTGNNGTDGTQTKFSSGSVVFQAFPGGKGGGGTTGATSPLPGNSGGPFGTPGGSANGNGGAGVAGAQMYSALGNPGSGGGGGITAAGVANNGGAGGANLVRGYFGGDAGVVGGAPPGRGKDASAVAITSTPNGTPGPGAGGGAASVSGAAQAGADAAGWGIGGGGGGASLNGNASGRGGNGVGGYLCVRAHLL